MKSVQRIRLKQVKDGRIRFTVDRVSRPEEVHRAVLQYYRGADREMLSVLCLDANTAPTCFNVASVGGLNTTRTRPADILKPAILSNATSIVLVHSHPSGNLDASPKDIEFTRGVAKACQAVGIDLYDHLIVADCSYVSLRERGLL